MQGNEINTDLQGTSSRYQDHSLLKIPINSAYAAALKYHGTNPPPYVKQGKNAENWGRLSNLAR